MLLPADSTIVNSADVTFRWEMIKGAASYRLQVASPSFRSPSQLYLDTLSSDLTLSLPLQPGTYEWRVQALNSGYQTGYTSRLFAVDSASNLSGSSVRLLTPLKDIYTNQQKVLFTWDAVQRAEKYILEILSPARFDTVLYVTSVYRTLPVAGQTYEWRVRALNATGAVLSDKRKFTTDFELPEVPSLLHPRPDTTIFDWPVKLKWKHGSTDVTGDSVFLYLADQKTLVSSFPKAVTTPYFMLTSSQSLVPGSYYWSVRSYDRAGNIGLVADKYKFIVK